MLTITSAQNDTYKKLISLTTAKGLKKEGWFLLSGENLVREFLASPYLAVHHEIITAQHQPLLKPSDAKTLQVSADLFDELDVVGTDFNLLVLEQPAIPRIDDQAIRNHQPQGLELVVPMGDPGNLGAMIRSAEAFGTRQIILTEEAAHPFLPKTVKASAGSVLRMPMQRGPALHQFPDTCMALDMGGTAIDELTWPQNFMLAVGEEGQGLGKAKFSQRISIPTQGVESLNAVVAASVALALWRMTK